MDEQQSALQVKGLWGENVGTTPPHSSQETVLLPFPFSSLSLLEPNSPPLSEAAGVWSPGGQGGGHQTDTEQSQKAGPQWSPTLL